MSAQRLRRWADVAQMLYRCFVFKGSNNLLGRCWVCFARAWFPQMPHNIFIFVRDPVPRKAKRQYLLTSQVSKYCLLDLQGRVSVSGLSHAHEDNANVRRLIDVGPTSATLARCQADFRVLCHFPPVKFAVFRAQSC